MSPKTSSVEVPPREAKPLKSVRERAVKAIRETCQLWHAHENGPPRGYASFLRNGHTEHVELRTAAGSSWVRGLMYKQMNQVTSRQDVEVILDAIDTIAIYDGPRFPIHIRVADLGDVTYLDLADDAWRVVEISSQGWRVIPAELAPVRFRRPHGTEFLPEPAREGSLYELKEFIHTDPLGLVLAAAWLVGSLTDRGPAPVLSLAGCQGTAKSTATRVLQRLVDPRGGALRGMPNSDEDLAVAARNSWIVSFDNLSRLSPDRSDALARLSTGAAVTTRQLHSNGEEFLFCARRPVIVNSIVDIIGRADLLERTIVVQLLKISDEQRVEESVFWPRFESARPRLLGALLTALSHALGRSKDQQIRPKCKPRMADFYCFANAIGDSLPGGTATFQEGWERMQGDAVSTALESAAIGAPLLALLEARGLWRAPAAKLLRVLQDQCKSQWTRCKDVWPQTPQGLVAALRRLAPALEAVGWRVELGIRDSSTTRHERLVVITQIKEKQS